MATRTIRFQLDPEYLAESIELLSNLYDGAEISIAVDNGDLHPIFTANTDVQKEQILVYEDSSTVLLKIKVIDKKRSDWELGNQIEFYTPIDFTDLDLALFRMTRGQGGELQCLLNDVIIFALINEKTDLSSIPNDILALFAYQVNDISKLPQMPITNIAWFQDCSELISLSGLSNLPSLHKLSLWKCKSIQSADILKDLTQLTKLDLFSCYALQNVDSLENLTQLTQLNLSFCSSLQNVDGLRNVTRLTKLDLSYCKSLQNVDALKNLTQLVKLNLPWCKSLQNVDSLINLTQLTKLNLSWCKSIQNADILIKLTQLSELDLSRCKSLQNVDVLEKLTQLTQLNLSDCKSLQNVDGLKKLTQLSELDLSRCQSLQNVDVLENLTQLTQLNLSYCKSLQNVDCLERLTQLTKLNLSWCKSIQNADILKKITQLTELDLSRCQSLQNVDVLENLNQLTQLDLSYCDSLQNVDVLENLIQLTQLDLSYCDSLQNVDVLENLIQLTQLDLSYCKSLQNVDSLEKLTQLTDLNLSNCKSLQNVDGLRNVTRLTQLDLSYCHSLQNVDGLRNVTQLNELKLRNCGSLQNVDGLENLIQLTQLDLYYCLSLQNVDGLENLIQLTKLDLYYCLSLQNVDGLRNVTQLTYLNLSDCKSLQNVDGLRNLIQLTNLDLESCESLSDVAGLGNLTQLTKLEISYCPYLLDFSPLQGCVSLKSMAADKPNIVIEILIHTAVLRKDTDYIFENFSDWLKECQSSPLRDSMLQDVVKALAICGNGSWVLKGLETIMRSMRTSGLNEKLLCDTLQVISDLEFSEEVKLIAEICLEPGKADQADAAEIRIRAHLSTFTSFPESSREWALSLALELTNIARTDEHLLNATAADIILFYARMDQEELLDEWLGLITPTAADTAYVALSRYYLGENNIEQALSCAANIQGSIVRDPISQQLAEYFVTLDPELSAEQFQIISDTALKTETAKHLMQHAEFTASPANFCALLMTLQTDRQALGEMLNTVIAHHPRASVFTDLFPPEVPANDVDSLTGLFNELGKGGFVDEGSEILQSLDGGDRQAILSGVLVTLAKRGKIS